MYRTNSARRRAFFCAAAIFVCLPALTFAQSAPAPAAKPPVPAPAAAKPARPVFSRLLPAETLVYIRVANVPQVRDEWWQTAAGRMAQDPQFKPLWDQLFVAVEKAFEPVRARIGLSVAELLQLPRGELGFAVLPSGEGMPGALLFVEAPDDDRNAALLLERGRATALEAGWIEESEAVGDVKLNVFRRGAGRSERVMYLRREGVLVIGTSVDAFKQLLAVWTGGEVNTLADQPAFVTLERMIGKAEGAEAQISFFVDPINLVRALNGGNAAAQIGLAMLPALGLDGLTALAGSFTFNRGPFESIGQAYLLLDVPRSGVLELIALQPTETEPEPWVFEQAAAYHTLTWDFERTYHKLRTLVDNFSGEGNFRRRIQEAMLRETDVDLEADVLPQLDGRASFLLWIEEPVSTASRSQLYGVHLKDGKKFAPVLKKFTTKLQDKLTVKSYAGTTYYVVAGPKPEAAAVEGRPAPPTVAVQPAFCLLDDCLLMADRASVLEKALACAASDSGRLSSSLDYKLIVAKAKRYAGEQGPGYFGFTRPDEEIRFLHGLSVNDRLREQLGKTGESNAFIKDVHQALLDRPLPAVEALQQYFAPGGTILVDEPTGVRYLSFVLRRDGDKPKK